MASLTEGERDFIASLDYGNGAGTHREQLDRLIKNGGNLDGEQQFWFPYEVIELGKSWLQEGHEREFVACAGIVSQHIANGRDLMNDVEIGMAEVLASWSGLGEQHRALLEPLLEAAIGADP